MIACVVTFTTRRGVNVTIASFCRLKEAEFDVILGKHMIFMSGDARGAGMNVYYKERVVIWNSISRSLSSLW